MNYYPSKYEIYSYLLKKYVINKLNFKKQREKTKKRLAKIKLYEAYMSPLFCEPTEAQDFLLNLFLRIEAVLASRGRNIRVKIVGKGSFFVDRRRLTYFILELISAAKIEKIKICDNGIALMGDFNYDVFLRLKRVLPCMLLQSKVIAIPLKNAAGLKQRALCGVLESLENEFSPEYLWL